MIRAIRNADNYLTFSHASAVAFYSIAIAKKLKMLRDDNLNGNLGRWKPIKTHKNPKIGSSMPFSNQMLRYIDSQVNSINLKYDPEIRKVLLEDLFDLMHEYSKINFKTEYPSLSVNYDDNTRRLIGMAGLNIDIGKICIPNSVLNKKDKLSDDEWDLMKKHPVMSVSKLKEVDVDNPKMFAYIIGHHLLDQENSYPKVKGSPPVESKIIAVADMYDAMTSPRYYGRIKANKEALEQIRYLYEKDYIDEPLYLTAIHTFQEFSHEFVGKRHKKIAEASE
jgi:hypothetical protein